ncbi:unnamed protein product [Ceratitis capitata]|uniref:(Mediterranean fruit fly) hypothetical protein n=1 Tax=Ceratitis capitata TaxID=7213 RepID=A0A811U636_CERCA|nr:unnamed protein product [Ceratitis capitata]
MASSRHSHCPSHLITYGISLQQQSLAVLAWVLDICIGIKILWAAAKLHSTYTATQTSMGGVLTEGDKQGGNHESTLPILHKDKIQKSSKLFLDDAGF